MSFMASSWGGVLARADSLDSDFLHLLAGIAVGGARLVIDIDNGARLEVKHEDGVLGGIEDSVIARLAYS
jgi:hypothetical protein